MKPIPAAILVACLISSPLAGQDRDAQVLEPGQLRLFAAGEYGHLSSIFASSGTLPFDGGYSGVLTPETFGPLTPLSTGLASFFEQTGEHDGGGASDPAALDAGTLSVELGWNTRYFPLGVSLGVLPRVEIGARIPIFRNERFVRRFDLGGGNLGLNPDVEGNGSLMASIGAEFASIGGSEVLPLAGSPLAVELQHRVLAATGQELTLPETPLTAVDLESAYAVLPLPYLLTEWRPGDLELGARVALLRNFAGLHPLRGDGFHYRVAAVGDVRLATGQPVEGDPLIERGPEVGFAGGSGGLHADLFVGEKAWISAGGTFRRYGERSVAVAIVPPDGPFAAEVEVVEAYYDRGDELDFWFTPRLLLTREISFGLGVRSEHWREGSHVLEDEEVIPMPGRSRQSFGFSVRYTTLPRAGTGDAVLPFDVAIGYQGAFRGSEGVAALRTAFIQVSLIPRLWGGGDD